MILRVPALVAVHDAFPADDSCRLGVNREHNRVCKVQIGLNVSMRMSDASKNEEITSVPSQD